MIGGLRLKLPATSANLGPGFDTLALALALYLELDAGVSRDGEFSLEVTGRNTAICSRLEGNLLLSSYRETVRAHAGSEATPLAITMRNGIPLGMGCGSSAASRIAGVALANHFGELGWDSEQILAEASRLEGHPDNAAACWLGGFVASGAGDAAIGRYGASRVAAISIKPPSRWHAMVVLPKLPLATTESRAILPEQYSRRDAVLNLQRVALLTAAFAAGRGDLLAVATGDSIHQPYRSTVCPLLPALQPLAGEAGVLSVTLSGAGPSVLLLLDSPDSILDAEERVRRQARQESTEIDEILTCDIAGAAQSIICDQGLRERLPATFM